MTAIFADLARANILHHFVTALAAVLGLCFLVSVLLSWVLQGRENKVSRFFSNIVGPIWEPLDHVIPRVTIGGLPISIGFLAGWWLIGVVAVLINQALPAGW